MKAITPEQYQRIGELYYAAMELAPESRLPFLTVECGTDEVLRHEVESLIAAREEADGFVAGKVAGVVAEMADRQERQAQIGQSISHYKVLSLLGAGGMGEVYLAQDSLLERKVALKLLPSVFTNNQDRLRRFKKEARSVSALNHPNILTIYEVGVIDETHFIATEFIDGQSLRERLSGRPLELDEALDFAIQIASALTAAHEAGIIHRDIKPENVMIRRDGIIKVLDFGLAKLTESQIPADLSMESARLQKITTAAGMVMGTPQYMSPEQARGDKVDARTDIFSLGVALYEMIAGRPPFESAKPMDVIASILKEEPAPLVNIHPGTPPELETIVGKALRKDRDERYETANDLLADLKDLKRRLEFQAELEKSAQPDLQPDKPVKYQTAENSAPRTGEINYQTAISGAIQTGESPAKAKTTSIQFAIPRRAMLVGVMAVALAVVAATLIYLLRPKPILTDKDTILLTEFDNQTGEAVFDETLRQGLAVQLQQSPFLDIFADTRVRSTLRLMNRSPDERVTRASGREICQRQGLKALIAGSIAKFDHNYSITLEALNGLTGDSLALTQVEAVGKDEVLKALSRAATELRGKLGESLGSIQKFDAQLERTTSSLDALKEYTLGQTQSAKGQNLKAIEYMRRAVEKDPNFASAWNTLAIYFNNANQPGLAEEYAAKAFALRDRVSEGEKARITVFYYKYVTGELDKAIEAQEAYKQTYPREHNGPGNLSDLYLRTGQVEKAVAAAREAILLNPNTANWHANLVDGLVRLNRFAEAKEACARAAAQKLDSFAIRRQLYILAFISRDEAAMQEQIAWLSGKTNEFRAVNWQAQTSAFAGEWRKSQELSPRSIEMAVRNEAEEVAAQFSSDAAMRAAALGQTAQARTLAETALKFDRTRVSLIRTALALAFSGEAAKAQSLIQELEQKYPKDTIVNQLWLPAVKAGLELRKGNGQAALALLEPAKRYESAAEFWPQTVRGLVYMKLGKGAEAAAEYRKILDHRGESPLSLLWALAHLGLARAAALQGDAGQSRQSYEAFLALWKGADADLPILIEAKREYEKK